MNINIILPDEVRVYVEAQFMEGAYSSIGEFSAPRPKTQGASEVRGAAGRRH